MFSHGPTSQSGDFLRPRLRSDNPGVRACVCTPVHDSVQNAWFPEAARNCWDNPALAVFRAWRSAYLKSAQVSQAPKVCKHCKSFRSVGLDSTNLETDTHCVFKGGKHID